MEYSKNKLLITFVIRELAESLEMRCVGCREVFLYDSDGLRPQRRLVEHEGRYVPVADAEGCFAGHSGGLSERGCIVIIERRAAESGSLLEAVLFEDMEGIFALACGELEVPLDDRGGRRLVYEMDYTLRRRYGLNEAEAIS